MKINVHADHHIINPVIYAVNFIIWFSFSLIDFIINIAKVVGSSCTTNEECGSAAICKGKRCSCKDEQQLEAINDTDGRPIIRCKDNGDNGGNGDNGKILFWNVLFVFNEKYLCLGGIDQIRFNPVLILFFILARIVLM